MLEFDYREADLYGGALYHYNGRVVHNDVVASLKLDSGWTLDTMTVHPAYNRVVELSLLVEQAMVALEVFNISCVDILVGYQECDRGVIGRVIREEERNAEYWKE